MDISNIPKDIVAGTSYYAEQNGFIKIFTGCVWKMNGLERRIACPSISFQAVRGNEL